MTPEHEGLKRLILALPRKTRLVLILRYFEGLSAEETAAAMDLHPHEVRYLLRRTQLLLNNLLGAGREP